MHHKMPQMSICRMCLGTDLRMITIAGTPLQAVYEKVTEAELLDNMKPVVACYICLAQLKRCRTFMEKSVKADEVLNGILMNSKLTIKSVARIDRNAYKLNHPLSIKVIPSEDQEELDVRKVKKELEFEFAGADVSHVEINFDQQTDYPQLNEPIVNIDEKFGQPVVAQVLDVGFLKEEGKEEPAVSDTDDFRDAVSDDDVPLRPAVKKRKRNSDGEVKPKKVKVEGAKKASAKRTGKQKRDEPSVSDQKFKCNCGASFSRKYHLKRHQSSHTDLKPHQCNFCSASFSVHYHLKRHLIIHSNKFPYNCEYCQRRFKRPDHLKAHIKVHGITIENDYKPIPAPITIQNQVIEKLGYNNYSIPVPISSENLIIGEQTDNNDCLIPVRCEAYVNSNYAEKMGEHEAKDNIQNLIKSEANETFKDVSSDKLSNKIDKLSDENDGSNSDLVQTKSNLTPNSNVLKSHLCNECGAKFGRSNHLKRHLIIHSRQLTYECIVCPSTFNIKSELKEHFRTTHNIEGTYVCSICGRKFTVKINLERHILKHMENDKGHVTKSNEENRPSICSVCGLILNRKSNLKKHMLIHTGEKPYKCDKCNKSFNQSGTLATHLKMHAGIKPYECSVCYHKFLSKNNLHKHLSKHSDEKPHKCIFCNREFKRKDVMKMHMKTHSNEKPHECNICQRKFALKKSFTRHVKKHGIEKSQN
ncbi:zinc finger protein 260-like isoform X3 [Plodia interpunctella]|uniref:zinc finger protein 260-like isoform X3 n=1 Tax=Plodia interpunctella TaxID=58824 RepID=UPI0023685B42|nr:zinc finger protein 260-like isoform X3 [Plodia interpunctella]